MKKSLVYAALLVFALIYIYPFIVQVSTAFKTNADAVANPLALVPDPITTAAFERIAQTDFPLWFMNSVIVTAVRHPGPGLPRLARRLLAGPAEVPRPRRRVHRRSWP